MTLDVAVHWRSPCSWNWLMKHYSKEWGFVSCQWHHVKPSTFKVSYHFPNNRIQYFCWQISGWKLSIGKLQSNKNSSHKKHQNMFCIGKSEFWWIQLSCNCACHKNPSLHSHFIKYHSNTSLPISSSQARILLLLLSLVDLSLLAALHCQLESSERNLGEFAHMAMLEFFWVNCKLTMKAFWDGGTNGLTLDAEANSTDRIGVCVDDSLHAGLHSVMSEFRAKIHEKYSPDSFHRLFWDQQLKAMLTKPKQRQSFSSCTCVWSQYHIASC